MTSKSTFLLTFAFLTAGISLGQCPIQPQSVTGTNVICSGSGIVNVASSESGVNYYLRRNSDNSIVSGPIDGTGAALSFSTGIITSPTDFNVYAKDASQSLDFDPLQQQYISLGTGINTMLVNTSQITVEAWINLESNQSLPTIIGNYGMSYMQFLLRIDGGKPTFWVGNQFNNWNNAQGQNMVPLNRWVHIAGTWDGSTIKVYMDGALVSSAPHAGTFASVPQETRIGASLTSELFNGRIDNVRVWNVTKSGSDINSNKSICLIGNETNLIAYYDFENITGTTVEDLTGNNFDGTLINSPVVLAGTDFCAACTLQMPSIVTISIDPLTDQAFSPASSSITCGGVVSVNLTGSDQGASYYLRDNANNSVVAGPFTGTGGPITLSTNVISTSTFNVLAEKSGLLGSTGDALVLDGSNDFVNISGASSDLTNNDFTIEAWINTTGINEGILTKSDGSSGWEPGEKCFYIDGTGHPVFVGWGNDFIIGGTVVNDGTWHHVAVSWNYSTSTGKIYVDGIESTISDNYQTNVWDNTGNSLKLGSANFAEAPNYFSGMMDEVRIWNITRTASQIATFKSACLFGNEPGLLAYYQFENETGLTVTDLTGGLETGTLTNFSPTPYASGLGCGASCALTMSALYTATINPLADLAVSPAASSVICSGDENITVANSEPGISYVLRDDSNDNIVSGPLYGNGGTLTFNTGNVNATTTYNVFANKSLALNLDGMNDYIQTPVVGINGVFTFETWIKTNDPSPEWSGIFTTNTYSGTGMFAQFCLSDNGTLRWESNSPNLMIPNMTTVINNNVWHHVAAVSDGSNITFYVDGNLELTTPFIAGSFNRNLSLMAERQLSNFIPGQIDEARVWTTARTQAQIQASMNSCLTGGEQGLMIYYNFDNAGTSVATDIAGADHNGTIANIDLSRGWADGINSCVCSSEMSTKTILTVNPIGNQAITAVQPSICNSGSTTIDIASSEMSVNYFLRDDANDNIIAGPVAGTGNSLSFNTGTITSTTTYNVFGQNVPAAANTALEIDGNDYVSVPSGISLANQSFTIEFWAKRNGSNSYNFAFGQGTGNANSGLHIGFRDNNNFTFAFWGNDLDVATPAATDGMYHHWSCVYNAGISGTDRYIYLDGVLVASDDAAGDYTGSGELKIGSNPGGTESFNGKMDEVRIWNVARTQSEIQNNMNNCIAGTNPGLLANYDMTPHTAMDYILFDNSGNNINGTLMNMDPNSDWVLDAPAITCVYCSMEMPQTVTVTVNSSTSSTITETACDSYSAPDGATYTTSGIQTAVIPNMAGCDSTITIDLTIINSTASAMSAVACDSYTWPTNGNIYNASGTYPATLQNAAGCDSVITLSLIINNSSMSVVNEVSCGDYTWPVNGTTYNVAGMYTATMPNAAGCDSTISLNLTINNADATVTTSGATLTANVINAGYAWLNCDNQTTIPGETSQSFTAMTNGNYAAIVTENGCTDTSACVNISSVGIAGAISSENVALYPNPASGLIYITQADAFHNTQVNLITLDGKSSVLNGVFTGNRWSFDLSEYSAGIYFIEVRQDEKITRMKLIKQ